ncbi:MAG: hypothetical protein OSB09_07355 [Planctomycetota bacterium]|nr:hypothetical protein [Planctomycetota bacterium]
MQQGGWNFTTRTLLVEDTNREPLEIRLVHRLTPDLQVGLEVEVGVDSDEYYPVLNYRIFNATEEHPALVIGTSSAGPSDEVDGNAVTLTAAQMLGPRISGTLTRDHILAENAFSFSFILLGEEDPTISVSVGF